MEQHAHITAFPFASLPQLSTAQIELKKKLLDLYGLLEDKTDLFRDIARPVCDVLKANLEASLTHVEALTLQEILSSLPESVLLSAIRMEPHTKRSLLIFDSLLAQQLVSAALSGGKSVARATAVDELKPLTPLTEAVAEYVIVSAIEAISQALGDKNFSLRFENVVRDPQKLLGMFSNGDSFAVFSVRLSGEGREFYLKCALPLSLAENLAAESHKDAFFHARVQGFQTFKTDFQLEVGHVELAPEDVDAMSPGDIILLDECYVDLGADRAIKGQAMLRPGGLETDVGYVVSLSRDGDVLKAKVESVI